MLSIPRKKKRVRGVNGPHRFSLRGSNTASPGRGKTPRTLAHAREGQALRRAQRGGFFFAHEKVRPGWESNQRPRVGVPSGWASQLAAQP